MARPPCPASVANLQLKTRTRLGMWACGVGDTWTRLLSVITRPVVTRQLASNQPPGPTVREGLGACRLAWTSAPARTAKPLGNPEAHVRPACASRRRSSRHAGGAWAAVKVSDRTTSSPTSQSAPPLALVAPGLLPSERGAAAPRTHPIPRPASRDSGWWRRL
jgi:hypothetical protein